MTTRNYEEMRNGTTTKVLIPYSANLHTLQIRVYAFHRSPLYACVVISSTSVEPAAKSVPVSPFASRFEFELVINAISSGIYRFKCSGIQYQFSTSKYLRRTASLALHLDFITGSSLTLAACLILWQLLKLVHGRMLNKT